jgi:predicted permease
MNLLHQAARSLAKSPGFTTIALLTLALGIGVNTAMFSVVDTLLFKAAPFPEPLQLVRVYRTSPQSITWPHSPAEVLDLHDQASSFEHFAAFSWGNFNLAEPGQPAERISGLNVGTDFFAALKIQPRLGRTFAANEFTPGEDRVIVLSEALWRRRFAGDPGIAGRRIRLDGEEVTVLGVMPASADYPLMWGRVDAWKPLAFSAGQRKDRGNHWLNAIARLKHGVGLAQAQAELNTIVGRWAKDFPEDSTGAGLRAVRLHQSTMDSIGRNLSGMVMGLAGFVLLIACANLANLQLARTGARARDFAIRSALGASRLRLIAELVTESVLLSVAGGALGLVLATWVTDALGRRIVIGDFPGLSITLDWPVLIFALAVSLATGVAFGLLPGWAASRTDVNVTLKQQGRGTTGDRSQHRLRNALIVAEVALALTLLTGAGFFVRGLQRFTDRDPGWGRAHVLTATVNLPYSSYGTDERRRTFYREALRQLNQLPGVEHAALSSTLPVWGFNSSRDIVPEGQPRPPRERTPLVAYACVTPDFFAVLQIPLQRGRLFPAEFSDQTPALVIVNETLARQFWPNEDPIGKRLGSSGADNKNWYEVIGVVGDVAYPGNLARPDTPLQMYRPLAQEPWNFVNISLRTSRDAALLARELPRAIAAVDADVPAYHVATVDELIDRSGRNFQLTNQMLVAFAVLGLLLAALGLYGVISGIVVRRTPEFGIRIALGARNHNVLWLVLRQGMILTGLGALLGMLGSVALLRLCAAMIPALPGLDYLLLAGTIVGLGAVALLACWIPARRATQVDPMIALRAE